jgi:hypothetical protein
MSLASGFALLRVYLLWRVAWPPGTSRPDTRGAALRAPALLRACVGSIRIPDNSTVPEYRTRQNVGGNLWLHFVLKTKMEKPPTLCGVRLYSTSFS